MIIRLVSFVIFLLSFNLFVTAQTDVQVLRGIGGKEFYCTKDNGVISEAMFDEMTAKKQCSGLATLLNIDFENESLISFLARGDCHVRASAKVFRDDEKKKYSVKIQTLLGGCRAAGKYQGWLVVDKLKTDYTIEFTEAKIDKDYSSTDIFSSLFETDEFQNAKILPLKDIELKNCIQSFNQNDFVIKTREEFLKAIRNDASRDWCLKNSEPIDFSKNSLLGKTLRTDYCNKPAGLTYELVKHSNKNQYFFNISYLKPELLCRRIGYYSIWVLTPKISADSDVKFNLKVKAAEK